jgi:hypothetical protein
MGDLPGSPSVAPSPLFSHGSVGGGSRGEPRDCPGGCGTALRGRPGASTRRRRGQNGGQHRRPRRCLHRSTQRRRRPRNLRLFVPLLPSLSFLVSSRVFLLFFFASGRGALLPGPKLRNPAPAREVAESSRSVRRRRGEESKRWVGPFRIERSRWPPSPPPRPGDVR